MMKPIRILILMIAGLLSVPAMAVPCLAQKIDAAGKAEVINKITEILDKNYVFPEVAEKMGKDLKAQSAKGEYDAISESRDFANRLTADLQSISHDRHLRVSYSDEVLPVEKEQFVPSPEFLEKIRKQQLRENFGVAKVEILKGNIGLIKFNYFTNPAWVGEIYTAAMNYVANTDVLILDLRDNGGSMHPDAIPFLCSYFFEEPVHLNDIYWRPENFTHQFWTYHQVPGKRYLKKPIYILTSNRTFSGAEEITYDLKNLKRATIIGETTGGGANGGGDIRINDHYSVFTPTGRAINPITKTNWEGTGVKPDIEIASNKALYTAYIKAIDEIVKTSDDNAWKPDLSRISNEAKAKLAGFRKVEFKLKGFTEAKKVNLTGDFNSWSSRSINLSRAGDVWTVSVELEPGKYSYKFIVDGKWIKDPANSRTEGEGETQNSVIEVN